MERNVIARGITLPYVRRGDDIIPMIIDGLKEETYECILHTGSVYEAPSYDLNNNDVICITESLVARSMGMFVTIDEIADDIDGMFSKGSEIVLVNPIYSRNRFAMILRGIARAAKRVTIVMPEFDEVGNPRGVNPNTGVNIKEKYSDICAEEFCICEIVEKLEDCPLDEKQRFIYAGLHDYQNVLVQFEKLCEDKNVGPREMISLKDICKSKNPDFGLLGTNKASERSLKLFPSKKVADDICERIKEEIKRWLGVDVIVLVYGDGCFKCPVTGIWEFADPVTCPGYTDKELLESSPNEIKLKALIDGSHKTDEEISNIIEQKSALSKVKNSDLKLGTTPRRYMDLLASMADLISGSGDRCTPVVLIQNYF